MCNKFVRITAFNYAALHGLLIYNKKKFRIETGDIRRTQ